MILVFFPLKLKPPFRSGVGARPWLPAALFAVVTRHAFLKPVAKTMGSSHADVERPPPKTGRPAEARFRGAARRLSRKAPGGLAPPLSSDA